MRRLLAVYNICGISGTENITWYIDSIRSLLGQTLREKWGEDYQIAVSGCKSDGAENSLIMAFGPHLSYNFVREKYPLSVTFNSTVMKCVEHFGEFETYLYIDSGITFWDPCKRYDALEKLYEKHKSGPYGITAAFPSNDDGHQWWGIQYEPGQDYIFKIGQTTNMHCQMFDNEWRRAYGKILPDIFASNCMESVFSHMAAAIQKKFVMTQDVHVLHMHSMDGASIGFREDTSSDTRKMSDMFNASGLLYKTKKSMDARYQDGIQYGFGFEEYQPFWIHDHSKFSEEGFALDERLLPFLKREMFLTEEELNYCDIPAQHYLKNLE